MTISAETDSVAAVMFAVAGGKFRLRLTGDVEAAPGHRSAEVLDDGNNVIGSAHDYIYQGRGFAVHTRPYGGFVPVDQIEFV